MDKLELEKYSIKGKEEIQVQAEVNKRLMSLVYNKEKKPSIEQILECTGKDTLFYLVSSSYLLYINEGAKAVKPYIEKEVHKLFMEVCDEKGNKRKPALCYS